MATKPEYQVLIMRTPLVFRTSNYDEAYKVATDRLKEGEWVRVVEETGGEDG